jgi:F-type H+-transporting ATPase subunit delta
MSDSAVSIPFDSGREYLGAVYAKALYGAADKAGVTEGVLAQLDSLVVDVLDKMPKFEAALVSLRVSLEDKERMIENAFASQADRVLVNALKIMVRHSRFNCLREVQRSYRKIYNTARGQIEVEVRTAAPINNQLLAQIKQKLEGMLQRKVEIKVALHPEILGGLVVRVGDTLFDGSLVSKLEQLRSRSFEKVEASIRNTLDRYISP